jgi:LPS export ABC transporter protein LptC
VQVVKILITILLIVLEINCKKVNFFKNVIVDTNEPPTADIVIKNFNGDGFKTGKPTWKLNSSVAFISYETGKINMDDMKIIYHGHSNEITVLTSKEGELDRTTNDMIIEDDVRVESSNGRKLFTEKLFWNDKKKILYTNVPVRIIYPNGERINGSGMRSDGSLNNIVIFNPVGIHPPEND